MWTVYPGINGITPYRNPGRRNQMRTDYKRCIGW